MNLLLANHTQTYKKDRIFVNEAHLKIFAFFKAINEKRKIPTLNGSDTI